MVPTQSTVTGVGRGESRVSPQIFGKRGTRREAWTDRVLAVLLAVPVGTLLAFLVPLLWVVQGRPIFYAARRAGKGGAPFLLWKLRTMKPNAGHDIVLGGNAMTDVTPVGRWLRRTRLDEVPQILNLLRGEMVFVGPRPPLPRYVEAYPDLYLPLLSSRPGITGLATVFFCHREGAILARARSARDVEFLYRGRCLRQKVRLDTIYRRRRWFGLTLMILVLTFWRGPGAHRTMRRLRHGIERISGYRRAA